MAKPKTLKTALRHFIKEDSKLIHLHEQFANTEDIHERRVLKKELERQQEKTIKAHKVVQSFDVEEDEFNEVVCSLELPSNYCLELIDYNNFF